MSSAWPSATVIGVRSSWDASWMNCRSRSLSRALDSYTRRISSVALWRRRACHTMATNIADINGTSVISSTGCSPLDTSIRMKVAVSTITATRVTAVRPVPHTRKPYSRVRLTQMKWNGTVSQLGNTTMPARLATEKAIHAASIHPAWRKGHS